MQTVNRPVAVITGSTSGIGLATAKKFASEGYAVVINSSTTDGHEIATTIGTDAAYVQADISIQEGCKKLIAEAVSTFGSIDVLVNNAGIFVPQDEIIADDAEKMFATKLLGIQHCSNYAIQHGVKSIINTSSVYAQKPEPSAYLASALQAGVENLTRNYAKQYAETVRVNAVAPGYVDTPMLQNNIPPENLNEILSQVPLGRLIQSSEIADVMYFIATNHIVTGQCLVVDGGYLLR